MPEPTELGSEPHTHFGIRFIMALIQVAAARKGLWPHVIDASRKVGKR